jgi:hypothetical protein
MQRFSSRSVDSNDSFKYEQAEDEYATYDTTILQHNDDHFEQSPSSTQSNPNDSDLERSGHFDVREFSRIPQYSREFDEKFSNLKHSRDQASTASIILAVLLVAALSYIGYRLYKDRQVKENDSEKGTF